MLLHDRGEKNYTSISLMLTSDRKGMLFILHDSTYFNVMELARQTQICVNYFSVGSYPNNSPDQSAGRSKYLMMDSVWGHKVDANEG